MNIVPAFVRRRIAHRPNLVKIVDNIGWLFFDKVLRMGVGLLVGVWIARYLGPEQFGLLNFALAFTGLFGAIATLGLQGIVVRDIVRNSETANLTLGTAAIMQFAGGFLAYLMILGTIAYLRPDDALARCIVAILGAMLLLKASEIGMYWFESQVQSKYMVWIQNITFLFFGFLKIILIYYEKNIMSFAWVILAEASVVAILLILIFARQRPGLEKLIYSNRRAKELLKDGLPLALSSIAVSLYMKIDQIMISQMKGNEAVGLYSAASRISEIWYFIPTIIVVSIFPSMITTRDSDINKYQKRLVKLFDAMSFLAIATSILLTAGSDFIIEAVFGSEYRGSASILAVHIWGSVFVFMGIISSRWLISEGKQWINFQRTLSGLLVNIVLNYILIPVYGALGAAIALVISQFVASFLFDLYNRETKPIFLMKLKSIMLINYINHAFNYLKK